jgi:hypothetical protein
MTGEIRLIIAILRDAIGDAMKGQQDAIHWINGPIFAEYVEMVADHSQAEIITRKARQQIRSKL